MARGRLIIIWWTVASSAADFAVGFVANCRRPAAAAAAASSPPSARGTSTTSLAARGGGGGGGKKKRKKPARAAAQTSKGFGAPPPRLEDVLAGFRTRIPDGADDAPCPCGSGGTYGGCCGPLHRGERACTTMTDVLMSRYSAFSWRIVGYVMDTTHESCRDYREDRVAWARDLDKGGMFDSFEFVGLDAGPEEMSEGNENEGFIEFRVTLQAKEGRDGSPGGRETVITERSRFLRDPNDGIWSYASGDVRSDVAGLEETTLNA